MLSSMILGFVYHWKIKAGVVHHFRPSTFRWSPQYALRKKEGSGEVYFLCWRN